MTLALQGIAGSRGVAIGRAYLLDRGQPEIFEYAVPEDLLEQEIQRYLSALQEAREQLTAIRERVPAATRADVGAFIDTHLLMLEDSTFRQVPLQSIRERLCNAEWALKAQRDRLVKVFEEMDDPYLATRRDDIDHVVNRILRILLRDENTGAPDLPEHHLDGRVVIADDLTPADTLLLQHQGVAAFVTEHGGPLSHTAILARNLGIPAVVGVRSTRRLLQEDETLVVDGHLGVVLADVGPRILHHYRARQRDDKRRHADLRGSRDAAPVTLDGQHISLQANIELPEDVCEVQEVQADGVGLYRTEYLFMNRSTPPDEEEHFSHYRAVAEAMAGRPVTIRTLDIGADKQVDGGRPQGGICSNPALGLRAIRLCLKDLDLFRPQLRAILRSSAHGPVRMMIPMLSSLHELRQVQRLVTETKRALQREGLDFDPRMPVGGMVEVPAVAVSAALFARYLDFLSLGTNDLIQYTLAIDRIDDEVNYLYDPLHPAVLRLVHETLRAGRSAGKPVSLCGEMAGEVRYVRLLLGLGLTEFSMHPSVLLEVKHMVRNSNVAELKPLVRRLLASTDAAEMTALLMQLTEV